MIKPDEAIDIIIENTSLSDIQTKNILDCMDFVLAEDIYSSEDLPSFDKSAMDGYAIKINDEKEFEIIGTIKAGDYYNDELQSGKTLKIMTGAAFPNGADSVIQIEKVDVKDNKLIIHDEVEKGLNVIKKGSQIKSNDLVLKKGTVIRPYEIGLLASLGYDKLKVYGSPDVSLLITGDELVDINEKLENGKIRNSNGYSLFGLVKRSGANPLSMNIVKDNKDILKQSIIDAFEKSDIVITSGGASVGDYDFVEDVLEEIGADVKFRKIKIKPGKPLVFAKYNEKLFFGLPGNPLSSINVFEQFVQAAISKMIGKSTEYDYIDLIAGEDFKDKKGRTTYFYVNIKKHKDKYYAYKSGGQSSNSLKTISNSNGLIVIPEKVENVKMGEFIKGRFLI
ncbi:molybdopterin molybdotransferase MoeA [Tepidibacter aestuarii]|uniref:molybdopterin molybdotransferase MoeA n=1 Tax=Tepidibacter aestuarii TaxID=2925782 RepID=UPI0020BE301E|nr:gephyrin-like molybdotransferase Glp [Tepidibacter aestuarii]CAH2214910.1 Molybdopterin molybdenumtransferase [Tepidibacter aestuarii]